MGKIGHCFDTEGVSHQIFVEHVEGRFYCTHGIHDTTMMINQNLPVSISSYSFGTFAMNISIGVYLSKTTKFNTNI